MLLDDLLMSGQETESESVTMVPVAEILRRTVSSIDFHPNDFDGGSAKGWQHLLGWKLRRKTLAFALWLIDHPGEHLDPIRQSESYGGYWHQGNGHHRLTAYILAGRDEIPVIYSGFLYGAEAPEKTAALVWEYLPPKLNIEDVAEFFGYSLAEPEYDD